MNNKDVKVPFMSRDIIEKFMKSSDKYATVEIEPTGRTRDSVYNALLGYIKRHNINDVSVRLVKGDVVLVNNEKHREDAAVHP